MGRGPPNPELNCACQATGAAHLSQFTDCYDHYFDVEPSIADNKPIYDYLDQPLITVTEDLTDSEEQQGHAMLSEGASRKI